MAHGHRSVFARTHREIPVRKFIVHNWRRRSLKDIRFGLPLHGIRVPKWHETWTWNAYDKVYRAWPQRITHVLNFNCDESRASGHRKKSKKMPYIRGVRFLYVCTRPHVRRLQNALKAVNRLDGLVSAKRIRKQQQHHHTFCTITIND